MSTLQQSPAEVLRVVRDWAELYAPKTLIQNEHTASLLVEWVLTNDNAIVSFSGLNKAVKALGSQVLAPEPKEPTPAEIEAAQAAKQEARMKRDYTNSIADQRIPSTQQRNQQRAEADKKAANEKELKGFQSEIEREIESYSVGHISGAPDYSKTESGRNALRSVRDKFNRRTVENAKSALAAVRGAKYQLP